MDPWWLEAVQPPPSQQSGHEVVLSPLSSVSSVLKQFGSDLENASLDFFPLTFLSGLPYSTLYAS